MKKTRKLEDGDENEAEKYRKVDTAEKLRLVTRRTRRRETRIKEAADIEEKKGMEKEAKWVGRSEGVSWE